MIVSEARILANRANALKSSGPRTPEGKERSRANAVKHGLTGAGVAISAEEAEAVEARFAGYLADYRPATDAGRDLVRRAALLSIRLERSAVREAAAISRNVRAAEADFDEAREDAVDALFELLDEEPARAVRRLVRMPEGIDRMLDAWAGLFEDLTHGDGSRWTEEHGFLAVHLTGRRAGGFGIARVEALALAVLGDFSLLKRADGEGLDPAARGDWARSELADLMVAEAAGLQDRREALDFEAIEADRAGAPARALFDPSKEACLARKYEAAAGREMHRAIEEMKAIEAEAAGRGLPSPPRVASSSPEAPGRVVPASPMPTPMPTGARSGSVEGSAHVPITVGRPETTRF